MFGNAVVNNILARSIGHKGIIASKNKWKELKTYKNNLFTVDYNDTNQTVQFTTNINESPHLVLADKYLVNGVNFKLPLKQTKDNFLELDMRKGNLPARWALMLFEFGFQKNTPFSELEGNDVKVVSYVDKEFYKKCLDLNFASRTFWLKHSSTICGSTIGDEFIDFISQSSIKPIKVINNDDDDDDAYLQKLIKFYRFDAQNSGEYLRINKAPYVSHSKILELDNYHERCYGQDIFIGSDKWSASNRRASPATKIFTNECISKIFF